ncbi:MAG: YggU family protein [Moraxellaceae bacterium]|nr:YggU family protein [Moraxellaceae bacterium]MCP5177656.1 YggU family protein [Moraxellaceae bacterium]
MNVVQQTAEGYVLNLHIQPNAKSTEWTGLYGDALKLRLQAPPVDGKANEALCAFLAEIFAVKRHSVVLLSGQSSRHKRILIKQVTALPLPIIKILQGVHP